jgi:hypothetical protein
VQHPELSGSRERQFPAWHSERRSPKNPFRFGAGIVGFDKTAAAYEKMQDELEEKYMGKWVIFHEKVFIGVFESFESAATAAVQRFGRGPYLIRQVGIRSMSLPASAMFGPVHA